MFTYSFTLKHDLNALNYNVFLYKAIFFRRKSYCGARTSSEEQSNNGSEILYCDETDGRQKPIGSENRAPLKSESLEDEYDCMEEVALLKKEWSVFWARRSFVRLSWGSSNSQRKEIRFAAVRKDWNILPHTKTFVILIRFYWPQKSVHSSLSVTFCSYKLIGLLWRTFWALRAFKGFFKVSIIYT